ncbi:MAG: DUF4160 domain-containing protein [Kiritimatiellales bacterium]|nr:DUF4160 domain-containing protein [Kiritimatiellales bacterium]
MPKLYEYFGLIVLFYSNEHEPVHVHGIYHGCECRADLIIEDGRVVDILFNPVRGRRPLENTQLSDFKKLVNMHAEDIVQKWVDYFIMHKAIKPEHIDRRLK